ncbi:uncharacterized protein LOC107684175 isoform X1 [Sinocyclocheilus anshuiensis]|uniref:uncharacterized protein LOC107684175 isoform X1 n=1 Tax=Sinocyclocheilus anshuiensis TaxID=1608454 RepID=UPI0007B8FB8E|nr:PREDICTED: uncharacterized protein LOC107684175 isoform X1 [Sinocyclocheilus anshuiensis]
MEELINTQSDAVGRLAFKYMEMCKVDSSSDSESESNPRWSDVSSKGCESSTPEAPQKLQQNYQQCLDPYDGSSEDSGSSAEGSRKQRPGGFRTKGTGRRLTFNPASALRDETPADLHRVDVQMRSSSDSELESPHQGSDSGFHTRSSLNSRDTSLGLQSASPDSPALHAAFSKRKLFPASDDGMLSKRRCVSDVELESGAV